MFDWTFTGNFFSFIVFDFTFIKEIMALAVTLYFLNFKMETEDWL